MRGPELDSVGIRGSPFAAQPPGMQH